MSDLSELCRAQAEFIELARKGDDALAPAAAALREAADALERAERERDEAREALKPFAAAAASMPDNSADSDELELSFWWSDEREPVNTGHYAIDTFTVGEFRAAAKAIDV